MKSYVNRFVCHVFLLVAVAVVLGGCGQRVPLPPADNRLEDSNAY